ncbi:borealin-like [Dreissena polymorpha]|uniref:Borealin C-terminal domain-containing protein n=1 Tax=Dreissena polymorpha TaxID=45954 RepID=A0A9D4IP06_DREPO|nr:borealin-like [Dreissena polymorpha]KAH3778533.1 hypothetical protein DPMN_179998 [Dreissena polymorpha]
MPRKRNTTAASTRAKPKLPPSDADELVNGLTYEQRKEKLTNIVHDFKLNVAELTKQYEEEMERMKKMVDKHFSQIMLKLSPRELQMTLEEYVEYLDAEEKDEIAPLPSTATSAILTEPPLQRLQNIQSTLSKYKNRRAIDTIPEEGNSSETTTVKKTTRKKTVVKGKGVTFNADEPINSFVTPAAGSRNMSMLGWGATPMVTPKFDPRLPITPAMKRNVKPDELIMSMAGSPVNIDRKMTIIADNGEEIDVMLPERSTISDMQRILGRIVNKT